MKFSYSNLSFLLLLTLLFSSVSHAQDDTSQKIESLLSKMTLKEKIGQMHQLTGFWDVTGPVPADGDSKAKYQQLRNGEVGSMLNITSVKEVRAIQKIAVEETRLGIPLIFGQDVIHGFKTILPEPLAESASWDMEVIKKGAALAAKEATAAGINWTFAPMVDVSRDARWGRIMEGSGEDPFLSAQIAKARVHGFQGDDLTSPHTLAACAKHFAAYGFSESGKDYNTVDISDLTLHNFVLPPFKAAVDAGASTFMTSFNIIQGVPATANQYLIRDLLKDRWGFEGFVVSDWGSFAEMIVHGYAPDAKFATEKAIVAGTDMDMEAKFFSNHLEELVQNGTVAMEYVDDAVRRILKVKFDLGLFDNPYLYCDEQREKELIGTKENRSIAYESAVKSIVLLKNEASILPLNKSQKVAFIGPMVDDKNISLGNWRLQGEDNSAVSILEALKAKKIKFQHAQGVRLVEKQVSFPFEVQLNTTDLTGIEEAVKLAKEVDVVVLAVGEDGFQAGEGRSRAYIDLPGLQKELVEAVSKVNENIILVNHSGRPLDLTKETAVSKAVVQAWHLGTESGNAIVDVLYGAYNPTGKLPVSFPRSVGQLPIYYNHYSTGRPTNPGNDLVFWSHYMDEEETPLFAFGHGLSYSDIQIESFEISSDSMTKEGTIEVKVTLKNNSDIDGSQFLQLYIRDHAASYVRPVKELKDFKKVSLKAGASKTVRMVVDKEDLSFFGPDGTILLEPGVFSLMVGLSSDQLLEKIITLID